jgi:hypothetical protein
MLKIAVCAIFKDEASYLLELIAFHRMIGVDLFVLYDNGSTDGGAELVRRSSFARNVTLVEWADRPDSSPPIGISMPTTPGISPGRRSSTWTSSSCRSTAVRSATS